MNTVQSLVSAFVGEPAQTMGRCNKCGQTACKPVSLPGMPPFFPPMCNKCAEFATKERRKAEFEAALAESGLPRELWSYDRQLGNVELLDWAVSHADAWLWIGGHTGTGKTRALARALVQDTWRRSEWPTLYWAESAGFFLSLSERSYDRAAQVQAQFERAKRCGLLVVDDIGQESLPDHARAMLFEIIDYRYTNRLRTWFSSNADADEMAAQVGTGRWLQIRRRIAERGHLRVWAGGRWHEETAMCAPGHGNLWDGME